MATYYKYAERAAGSQVNWAEIGKNLTDTLQEENRIREEKKAAIEEATRQYGLELEKNPQGEYKPLNQWSLDYAADAQEARLLQDKLLRQGKLSLRDYTMMRQNLTDGTKQAFDIINEYNAEFKEKMSRKDAGESQYLEQWLNAQAEGFSNFTDSKLYINPTTFAVNVARNFTTKDGVTTMSDSPDDYTTLNELRDRIKARFDKFNSDEYLKGQVDLLGDEQRAIIDQAATKSKTGFTKSIEDKTLKEGFDVVQSLIINKAFADPNKISSVLTNDLGGYLTDPADPKSKFITFDYTWDKNKAGQVIDGVNYILLKKEGNQIVPQFDEKQKELAADYMKKKMNSMIDYKETMQGYTNPLAPQPSVDLLKYWDDKANVKAGMEQWNNLRAGTYEQKAAAVQYFRGIDPNIVDVKFTSVPEDGAGSGGVEFVYNNGNIVPYWFYDSTGGEISGASWMNAGNEILGGKVTQRDADTYGKKAKTNFGKDEAEIRASVGNVNQTPAPATGGGAAASGGKPR